jgi:DNA-binding beta-propeller fold protein YncE
LLSESAVLIFIPTALVFTLGFFTIVSGYISTPVQNFVDIPQSYSFVTKWGSKGTDNSQFLRPHDLEFDSHNKYLYAVDRDGNRIQVFDKNGTFLFKFGQKGHGDGQFLVPYGLDVDQAGNDMGLIY